uniref:Transcriptional regulator n=1 Tax=Gracilinema caldarium TaxID=215591 RepID=A0A7C3E0A6_9SPIR
MSIIVKELISTLPGIELLPDDTVDGYIYGSPETLLTGVAVTFLATLEHCYQARQYNCNLIISHEGIWYNHREQDVSSIHHASYDSVYSKKNRFIKDHNLIIYRYHDSIHRALPDRITTGLIKALDWELREIVQFPAYSILELDATLGSVLEHIKRALGLPWIRYIGMKEQSIHRVIVAVGYRGSGSLLLPTIAKENIDLVIFGEGPEWEIPEYCRDSYFLDQNKALIILGHGVSESHGMQLLADELGSRFQNIPIHYFPFQNPFNIG